MIQSLLGKLIEWDHQWFLKINTLWTHPLLDQIFPILTDLHKVWWFTHLAAPVFVILWIIRDRMRAVGLILGCILAFGIADATSYRLVKPNVQRERPNQTQFPTMQLRTNVHTGFSFPSNHATNMFAVATFLGLYIPYWRKYFLLFALVIAYSRVYVGVHFPLDVIGGAVLGIISGRVAYWISYRALKLFRKTFSFVETLPRPPGRFKRN